MRRIYHSDVCAAARVLLAAPEGAREALCDQMLYEAHSADKYARRTGRVHRAWGDGRLAAASMSYPQAPEPPAGSPEFTSCLLTVLTRIVARREGL
jgi:hypothetical protein